MVKPAEPMPVTRLLAVITGSPTKGELSPSPWIQKISTCAASSLMMPPVASARATVSPPVSVTPVLQTTSPLTLPEQPLLAPLVNSR